MRGIPQTHEGQDGCRSNAMRASPATRNTDRPSHWRRTTARWPGRAVALALGFAYWSAALLTGAPLRRFSPHAHIHAHPDCDAGRPKLLTARLYRHGFLIALMTLCRCDGRISAN